MKTFHNAIVLGSLIRCCTLAWYGELAVQLKNKSNSRRQLNWWLLDTSAIHISRLSMMKRWSFWPAAFSRIPPTSYVLSTSSYLPGNGSQSAVVRTIVANSFAPHLPNLAKWTTCPSSRRQCRGHGLTSDFWPAVTKAADWFRRSRFLWWFVSHCTLPLMMNCFALFDCRGIITMKWSSKWCNLPDKMFGFRVFCTVVYCCFGVVSDVFDECMC